MSLTLHYHPVSQPSRAVLTLLALGKIKYEGKVVDLFKGEQRTPEYKKITPFGTVPCLVHGELSIGESNAILAYLCDTFPEELKGYRGSPGAEKAKVDQILSWYQGSFRPALIKIMALTFRVGLAKKQPLEGAVIHEARQKMEETFDFLEGLLSQGNKYVCGNNLTIADLLIFYETTNVQLYKFDISKWAKVQAWYELVQQNEQVKVIHTQFRESLPRFQAMFATVKISKNYAEETLTVYTHPVSNPCLAVSTVLALGNIKYEQKPTDFIKGETRTFEFLELNPFGTIPFITHGDQKIGESNAILAYLCQTFPQQLQRYYGFTIAERAQVNQYISWYQAEYRPATSAIAILKVVKGIKAGKPISKQALEETEKKMCNAFDCLEGILSKGSPFICGQSLTIADILLFCGTTMTELYQFDISKWTNLKAWYDRILSNEVIRGCYEKLKATLPVSQELLSKVVIQ